MGAKGGAVRQERHRQVVALRAAGFYHHQIAHTLGISTSHVRALIYDPDGGKDRARKETYRGVCESCGDPTSGSDGPAKAPKVCAKCAAKRDHAERYWTQERVIFGIRKLGRDVAPRRPVAQDVLEKCPIDHDGHRLYPPYSAITREFGTWGNALVAAGFERPLTGQRTPEGQDRVNAAARRPRVKA